MTTLTRSRLALLVAFALTGFLVTADAASSHTLYVSKARVALKGVTGAWFRDSDLGGRYWVDGCSRRSAHRVTCKAHIQGRNVSMGANETCTKTATATLYRRTIKATLGSTTFCKFDYGQTGTGGGGTGGGGGGGSVAAPPAPDTMITYGPENGSTVETFNGLVTFMFVAVGGENPMFECSTDGAPFQPCGSPNGGIFSMGPHTFSVRAISTRLGAQVTPDPTPATVSFTLVPQQY